MTRYAIGIDLGGTHVKAASVAETGEVMGRGADTTRDGVAAGAWLPTIRALVERLIAERGGPPAGIGVGAPGIAAADGRSIAFMQGRLAGLQGLDWSDALEVRLPVRVLNDAHAALLGEAWTGAAAGCREVVLLTLGTGVGGAMLSEGRLVLGATGRAGHWGHVSLDPDGPPSITGMPGSLEGAIGNCTVAARTQGRFTDTRDLVLAHRAGDPLATRVWRRSVRDLAVAIASIANAVDPELVVVGGGIAQAGAALFAPLAEDLALVEWRPLGRRIRVLPAALGDLAGAIGAARAALAAEGTRAPPTTTWPPPAASSTP
jgi:glucokinase